MRVLNFEVQRSLFREIEDTRAVVSQLAESVCFAEARARQAEEAAARAKAAAAGGAPPSKGSAASVPKSGTDDAWIQRVGADLEELVWSGLQRRVEEVVQGAVSQATKAMLAAVDELREAASANAGASQRNHHARFQVGSPQMGAKAVPDSVRKEASFVVQWWKDSAACILNNRPDLLGHRRMLVKATRRELSLGGKKAAAAVTFKSREDAAAAKLQARFRGASCRNTRKKETQAAKTLQRSLRRMACRRREMRGENAFRGMQDAVHATIDRSEEWKVVFRRYLKVGQNALLCPGFSTAIRAVHPRLTSGQALALWRGYTKGTNEEVIDWEGFYAIAEAVAIDDHWAAEFADMSLECFQRLGVNADKQIAKLQARVRGSIIRRKKEENKLGRMTKVQAAIIIQKNAKTALAMRKSGRMSICAVSGIIQKRYTAWSGPFNKAGGGAQFLDRAQFAAALMEANRDFSKKQADALHMGYILGTGNDGVDIRGFCSMLEAAAYDFESVAEFADMSPEAFEALGECKEPDSKVEQDLKTAVIKIQKTWRCAMVRSKIGPQTFQRVAKAVYWRHKEWCRLFDQEVGEADSCDLRCFRKLAKKVLSNLHPAQVDALWNGYVRGTGQAGMELMGFCHIAQAAESRTELAEFADMSEEAFQRLSVEAKPLADAWRIDRPDLAGMFDEACGKYASHLGEPQFCQAILRAQPRLSKGQASALWRGYVANTGRKAMDLEDFVAASEAVEEGDAYAAQWADMCAENFTLLGQSGGDKAATMLQARFKGRKAQSFLQAKKAEKVELERIQKTAATKLQSLARSWKARRTFRRMQPGSDNFFEVAKIMASKQRAWAEIFLEAEKLQRDGTKGLLGSAAFHVALSQVHPRLSRAQVQALFDGITDGVGAEGISMKNFCHVAQAVAVGDDRASEFADIAEEDFVELGRVDDDAFARAQAQAQAQAQAKMNGAPSSTPGPKLSLQTSPRLQRAGFQAPN
eukprot:TRINITY_DN62757_c0_g1_i1.p1 TRINITY_DN62757_c0_g1~~TRINITY_DN62757_c0_g1_i1.p1  ORF type:complete len:1051 (+),score=267.78 TRINITY_DN62757_c0_g1_i1:212-3154(+)